MSTIDQEFQSGMQHHQRGELPQAEALYRRVLQQRPDHAEAMHYLGVIAHQVGRNDVAVELMGKSIALAPDQARFYSNHAEALRALGRPREAIEALRQALRFQPDDLDFNVNLGIALLDVGDLDAAEATLTRAAGLGPRRPEPWVHLSRVRLARGRADEALANAQRAVEIDLNHLNATLNLALTLRSAGQLEEALRVAQDAVARFPQADGAHATLGVVFTAMDRLADAVPAYERAISLRPANASSHAGLGNALHRLGRIDASVASYRRAVQLAPHDHVTWNLLGLALLSGGQAVAARDAFGAAVESRPNGAEYLNNLSVALEALGDLDAARGTLQGAVSKDPDHAMARANLGKQLAVAGWVAEAIPHVRRATELSPGDSRIHNNLLLDLHYLGDLSPRQMFDEHVAWAELHARPLASSIRGHENDRDADRRLRIGYVSPDFAAHSVADFIEPILAHHDKSRVEVTCFSNVARPDVYTERLRGYADHWHDITRLGDDAAAELIRAEKIDVLVDLAGHTAGNRQLVFARKPAPVQVTWLGYPNTTGQAAIDWRITDAVADSAGSSEHLHTERLFRLPRTFLCYRPYPESPDVAPPPLERAGHVTFGSFNNLSKVSPRVIDAWARVLAAVPGSRMLVKASVVAGGAKQRLRDLFIASGIGPERLELVDRVADFRAHLALYGRIDVALDTFPYHGTTTTCEALWMGVPVVTLAGDAHMSRVGVSLLRQVGLDELVAADVDDYVNRAARLANDASTLRGLRAGLRERVSRSPLLDAVGVTREIEAAYRQMWQEWVRSA